jgi:adenine-specific DNA-methyltransferase
MAKPPKSPLTIDTLKRKGAMRKNIPTTEFQSVMVEDEYPRPAASSAPAANS